MSDERVQAVIERTRKAQAQECYALERAHDELRQRPLGGVGASYLARVWSEAALDQDFKLSTDPHFVAKVCDIIGLLRGTAGSGLGVVYR